MDLDRLRVSAAEFVFHLDADDDAEPSAAADGQPGDAVPAGVLVRPSGPQADGNGSGVQRYEVLVDGWRFEVAIESAARALLRERATTGGGGARSSGTERVRAQIPGRIVSVSVNEGDEVDAGARLLSLEAMKMENEVRAPRAGRIARVGVEAGQRVELGDELVVIE